MGGFGRQHHDSLPMTQALLVLTTDNCRPTSKVSRIETFMWPEPVLCHMPVDALGDGWRLMAPPVMLIGEQWEWWMERESA